MELINNLDYLENRHLEDLILYTKYLNRDIYNNYFEEHLNENLKIIYDKYCLDLDMLNHFIRQNSLLMCKSIYYSNRFRFVKNLYSKINYTLFKHIITKEDIQFETACVKGFLEVAQFIYKINRNLITNLQIILSFRSSCIFGNLNIIKWLHHIMKIRKIEDYDITIAFRNACLNNQVDCVKYILQINNGILKIGHKEIELFPVICKYANLELVKIIWDLFENKEEIKLEICFYYACVNGNLKVSKWFYENYINQIEIHKNSQKILETCYGYGNLEMCKWVYSVSINVNLNKVRRLKQMSSRFSKELLDWIWSLP